MPTLRWSAAIMTGPLQCWIIARFTARVLHGHGSEPALGADAAHAQDALGRGDAAYHLNGQRAGHGHLHVPRHGVADDLAADDYEVGAVVPVREQAAAVVGDDRDRLAFYMRNDAKSRGAAVYKYCVAVLDELCRLARDGFLLLGMGRKVTLVIKLWQGVARIGYAYAALARMSSPLSSSVLMSRLMVAVDTPNAFASSDIFYVVVALDIAEYLVLPREYDTFAGFHIRCPSKSAYARDYIY